MRAEPEYPHRQPVFALPQQGGQVKFRGGEGVLAVSHKFPVAPDGDGAVGGVEPHAGVLPAFGQGKIQHIAADGVVIPGQLAGFQFLVAVPGIHGVDVLGGAVAALPLHLDQARHLDVVPLGHIEAGLFKAGGDLVFPHGIEEFPAAVQAQTEGFAPQAGAAVGGMGGKPVHLKYGGIGPPGGIKLHRINSFLWTPGAGKGRLAAGQNSAFIVAVLPPAFNRPRHKICPASTF